MITSILFYSSRLISSQKLNFYITANTKNLFTFHRQATKTLIKEIEEIVLVVASRVENCNNESSEGAVQTERHVY